MRTLYTIYQNDLTKVIENGPKKEANHTIFHLSKRLRAEVRFLG